MRYSRRCIALTRDDAESSPLDRPSLRKVISLTNGQSCFESASRRTTFRAPKVSLSNLDRHTRTEGGYSQPVARLGEVRRRSHGSQVPESGFAKFSETRESSWIIPVIHDEYSRVPLLSGHQAGVKQRAGWRAINAPHLVALVRAGVRFEKGKLVERPDESEGDQQVA